MQNKNFINANRKLIVNDDSFVNCDFINSVFYRLNANVTNFTDCKFFNVGFETTANMQFEDCYWMFENPNDLHKFSVKIQELKVYNVSVDNKSLYPIVIHDSEDIVWLGINNIFETLSAWEKRLNTMAKPNNVYGDVYNQIIKEKLI